MTLSVTSLMRIPILRDLEYVEPLSRMGLPLAEALRDGIPDAMIVEALKQVTIPPRVDLGIDFRWNIATVGVFSFDVVRGSIACPLTCLPPSEDYEFVFTPDECAAIMSLKGFLDCMPCQAFPDGTRLVNGVTPINSDHVVTLLNFLAHHPEAISKIGDLTPLNLQEPDHIEYEVLPVSRLVHFRDLTRFFKELPGVATRVKRVLAATLGRKWEPMAAQHANAVASHLLGIEVDLRTGSLVFPEDFEYACELCCINPDGVRMPYISTAVAAFLQNPALEGAMWSEAINVALNRNDAASTSSNESWIDSHSIAMAA